MNSRNLKWEFSKTAARAGIAQTKNKKLISYKLKKRRIDKDTAVSKLEQIAEETAKRSFFHDEKLMHRALKQAKQYTQMKTVKKLKEAKEAQNSDLITKFESELANIKAVKLDELHEISLYHHGLIDQKVLLFPETKKTAPGPISPTVNKILQHNVVLTQIKTMKGKHYGIQLPKDTFSESIVPDSADSDDNDEKMIVEKAETKTAAGPTPFLSLDLSRRQLQRIKQDAKLVVPLPATKQHVSWREQSKKKPSEPKHDGSESESEEDEESGDSEDNEDEESGDSEDNEDDEEIEQNESESGQEAADGGEDDADEPTFQVDSEGDIVFDDLLAPESSDGIIGDSEEEMEVDFDSDDSNPPEEDSQPSTETHPPLTEQKSKQKKKAISEPQLDDTDDASLFLQLASQPFTKTRGGKKSREREPDDSSSDHSKKRRPMRRAEKKQKERNGSQDRRNGRKEKEDEPIVKKKRQTSSYEETHSKRKEPKHRDRKTGTEKHAGSSSDRGQRSDQKNKPNIVQHPSWKAKQKSNEIAQFQGKKLVFD
ncbi:hypothetical protein BLNAU_6387 [Blattamonas nauphoetae]|uniref:Bud22 domain-containing protein n=1 Tax=Blattamonas nauphoetae TaxID=2049346 RepID=A0ABQ9Y4E8_9EUKA|nr:hypothetical protein BLNAU_6387 [Blattamonas nauphoetae]